QAQAGRSAAARARPGGAPSRARQARPDPRPRRRPQRPRGRAPGLAHRATRRRLMRVHVVDSSAYTPAYDHALCAALAREGADVELVTSTFAYGDAPVPDGYAVREAFYRRAFGRPGSRLRLASKLVEHVPDMVRYRRAARAADV